MSQAFFTFLYLPNKSSSLHQIAESKKDIENFNRQGETMDIQRKNLMKDLEEQLQQTESQAVQLQVRIVGLKRIL